MKAVALVLEGFNRYSPLIEPENNNEIQLYTDPSDFRPMKEALHGVSFKDRESFGFRYAVMSGTIARNIIFSALTHLSSRSTHNII